MVLGEVMGNLFDGTEGMEDKAGIVSGIADEREPHPSGIAKVNI